MLLRLLRRLPLHPGLFDHHDDNLDHDGGANAHEHLHDKYDDSSANHNHNHDHLHHDHVNDYDDGAATGNLSRRGMQLQHAVPSPLHMFQWDVRQPLSRWDVHERS